MPTADTVYRAEIDAPEGRRRIWDLVLVPVRFVAAGLGVLDETILGDLVVERIADGAEVLRVPVTGTEESANELAALRTQLAELTVEEFDDVWSIG